MSATKAMFSTLLALASGLTLSTASAATLTLNPTVDGQVTQNGGGAVVEVQSPSDVMFATLSGPLSTTVVFEFDLRSVAPSSVTGAQLVLTQFMNTGTSPGQSALVLGGEAGDGLITLDDIGMGTVLSTLAIDNSVNLPSRTLHVFEIDPSRLFSLSGTSAVSLRLTATDRDGVTNFSFFGLGSTKVDYDLIAPGVQGGVPAYLMFTTSAVPEPESVSLALAGLTGLVGLSVVARQRRARQPH